LRGTNLRARIPEIRVIEQIEKLATHSTKRFSGICQSL
jgi:hypothetical protein